MDLPSGTVTLLFSDVEGSTRLLLRLQSEYAAALDVHRAVLRRAWLGHHGVEVGTEGDSFMVAFASATDAVEAALAGQLGLQEATWPGGEPMRVRMGLHTGTPTRHADGYVGVDVHVAARVASAANGGQVLLSEATASLVRGRVDLLDVGRHRLKDLPGPERLFRLRAPMLLDLSTPVRSIGSTSNLPAQVTPLVGRDDDVRRVLLLAAEPQQRLVTLTGVGGTGKTRLALAAASAAAENGRLDVYFVALEGAATADDFWAAVAAALDLPSQRREIADIVGRLGESPAMLVLDNLEQVRGAPEAILHLLENSDPQLSVIATCRHPLHLPGEQEYPVPPLEVTEEGPNEGALELLVCCILRMRPSFQVTVANRPSLVEICRRLDGLPLALEIAAARLRLLSPRALLDQLDDVLDMRRSEVGRPLRHETLRATLRWSHDLLPTDAAHLFRCLSAFRGSADLDAVGWVWARVGGGGTVLELVEHLVDSSLIGVSEDLDGRPRVTMLNTVLAFADEQLQAADDADAVRLVVAEYFDDLTRRLYTDRSPGWRARLADRLELEQQAYLSCLAWLRSQIGPHHPSAAPMSLQMTYRIHLGLLAQRSRLDESARLLQQVRAATEPRTGLRMAACEAGSAFVHLARGELDEGEACIRRALVSVEDVRTDEDLDPVEADLMRFLVDNVQGLYLRVTGDLRQSRALAERQVEQIRDPRLRPVAVENLAHTALEEGNFEESIALNRRAAALALEVGDEDLAVGARHNVACALRLLGNLEEADQEFRDIGPAILKSREPALKFALAEDYAAVLIGIGRVEEAGRLMGAAASARELLGLPVDDAQEEELADALARAHRAVGDQHWNALIKEGRSADLDELLRSALATPA